MGRFAWTQSHHKQPSDGKHVLPDWFSKTAGEPSRQALESLVKEHKTSSPPGTIRTRSRATTLVSNTSHGHNSSSSRSSSIRLSRPTSQHSSVEGTHASPGKTSNPTKALLSKGSRIMRRQTSKFNAMASHSSDQGSIHESNARPNGMHRVKSAGQLLNLHSRRETMRPQISGPFDFQHVTHTNQTQFRTLKEAPETDLEQSFNAMQADQQPQHAIQGIPVADLRTKPHIVASEEDTPPPSPTLSMISIVPSTAPPSPKPVPPPKDQPKDHLRMPSLGGDIRMSRSMENFSWPNRGSPLMGIDPDAVVDDVQEVAGDTAPMLIAPPPEMATESAPADSSALAPQSQLAPSPMLDKPLPQAPTVVHAVSTSDLSTLFLKSTPLPEPPQHQKQLSPDSSIKSPKPVTTPHRNSIRHMQSVPANLNSFRTAQSSNETLLTTDFMSTSEVLTSPTRATRPDHRISVGLRKIAIDDWEDAIDYSWDHAFDESFQDDDNDVLEMHSSLAMSRSDILPQQSFQPVPSSARTSRSGLSFSQPIRHHKSEFSLRGLGINPADNFMFGSDFMTLDGQRESLRVPHSHRISGSPMSKSSSQESIILSIASSIMSTHRSSNSSTSFGDLNHFSYYEDEVSHLRTTASGSVSSTETVKTDIRSPPPTIEDVDEDTIVDLPLNHQRGASTSRIPYVPNRRSSMTPAGQAAVRQRSNTHTLSGRPRNTSRASYSLFPAARTNQQPVAQP